jgi:hypothetical protein
VKKLSRKKLSGLCPICASIACGTRVAGVRVRIGECEHPPFEIGKRSNGTVTVYDDVGAVERRSLEDRHGEQFEKIRIPLLHEGIAADPGEIELARFQKAHDFPVRPRLNELDGTADLLVQIGGPTVIELQILPHHDRRQPEPHRRQLRRLCGTEGQGEYKHMDDSAKHPGLHPELRQRLLHLSGRICRASQLPPADQCPIDKSN